jgi:hypothetical protein
VSGGVSTPGHGQGEGPDGYKLFAQQMTQETLGGAGAKRSPPDTPSHSELNFKDKRRKGACSTWNKSSFVYRPK